MIDLPVTIADIDHLIHDGVQESLHLDYKDSRAIDSGKTHEICKDVSAFANSDGGVLVYGVTELNHLPVGRDSGVDSKTYNREWLEKLIMNQINPRIEDVRIVAIPITSDRSYYAIYIPKTYRGAHQSADKKYYKRFNFQSVPMEDYEINDIRNRRLVVPSLVNVDVELERFVILLAVTNPGPLPAHDVSFTRLDGIVWEIGDEAPPIFREGIKFFPPGRKYRFFYHSSIEIMNDPNIPKTCIIEVSYLHPTTGQRISDVFYIDFMDFAHTAMVDSELDRLARVVKDGLKDLTREVVKICEQLAAISSIAGPTGLNVSTSTWRNLTHLLDKDEDVEKIDPYDHHSRGVFKEVLNVDDDLARKLSQFFRWPHEGKKLQDIEGMTPELVEKMRRCFLTREDDV